MKQRAQASLEYLMTYGWALVLIATLVGAFIFVMGTPSETTFTSSDPRRIMMEGSNILGGEAQIITRNISGGTIIITQINATCVPLGCTINGQSFAANEPLPIPIKIPAGGTIELGGIKSSETQIVEIDYTDFAGLQREVDLTRGEIVTGSECVLDTDCSGGLVCCDTTCTTYACSANEDCDDYNPLTTDICSNLGTCSASCSNVSLCGNGDLDDGEACDSTAVPDGTGANMSCNADCSVTITGCDGLKATLSRSGSYIVESDFMASYAGSYCMAILANDVELDCQGHTITGSIATGTRRGLSISAVSNIDISNCTFVFSWESIWTTSVCGLSLSNVTANSDEFGAIIINASSSECAFNLSNVTACNMGADNDLQFVSVNCANVSAANITATNVQGCEISTTPCS